MIEATVRDGHAVTALPTLNANEHHPALRPLSPDESFPALPPLELVLATPGRTTSLIGQKMRDMLLAVLSEREYAFPSGGSQTRP
ncbi:hypothetical protein [Rhizobium rhizogenes]|uniref:hypothetical protein n=1 Tax=Rhizobium rhizogenes TaxID=359 RepID=UPI0015735D8E|nr:hypothetical protein [Rhizobium rhizogenes]NTF96106.1 hypothetical protein [Rhizobium rhizogenes]